MSLRARNVGNDMCVSVQVCDCADVVSGEWCSVCMSGIYFYGSVTCKQIMLPFVSIFVLPVQMCAVFLVTDSSLVQDLLITAPLSYYYCTAVTYT